MRNKEKFREVYAALMKVYPFTLEDLDGEQWRCVDGHEGYQISNFGRVKSFFGKTQRIIKPMVNRYGYLYANLYGGKMKTYTIHRLVAKAFISNPENKHEINHRDGNKFNNHVENLEWSTSSENQRHAFTIGLQVGANGEKNPQAKLTAADVRYIRDNPENLTQKQLGKMFGVNRSGISMIQTGRHWKSVGGNIRESKAKRIPADVRTEIKRLYKRNVRGCGCDVLAKKFGVNHSTILRIVREDA